LSSDARAAKLPQQAPPRRAAGRSQEPEPGAAMIEFYRMRAREAAEKKAAAEAPGALVAPRAWPQTSS
jgi:hypothetical protein